MASSSSRSVVSLASPQNAASSSSIRSTSYISQNSLSSPQEIANSREVRWDEDHRRTPSFSSTSSPAGTSPRSTMKETDTSEDQTPKFDMRAGSLGGLVAMLGESNDYGEYSLATKAVPEIARKKSVDSMDTFIDDPLLDPDDPVVTGILEKATDKVADVENQVSAYRPRREERVREDSNVHVAMHQRQAFLMKMARALMSFNAPSHRIESQLLAAARILQVNAEFIHLPGILMCSFGDIDTKTSQIHFLRCGGRTNLGSLHRVHQVYRRVVRDELSVVPATKELEDILETPPLYGSVLRAAFTFFISSVICALAFGGSIVDMWFAGLGGISLSVSQMVVAKKGQVYTSVIEITVIIAISFLARAISTIPSQTFCYTAISSASIVTILPGYLIMSSSLELGAKSMVGGSIKLVYALIYTLFIAYGLQLGSDLYLVINSSVSSQPAVMENTYNNMIDLSGHFTPDRSFSQEGLGRGQSVPFQFSGATPLALKHIVMGCYRPPSDPWYLQPLPWWTWFINVPIFATLNSLANLQPWKTLDMIVMIAIACGAFTTNKIASMYVYMHTDIVSFIGAAFVGFAGTIYAKIRKRSPFTVMVTGILFMLPSGLSEAGGITAQGDGNAIAIGEAMLKVSFGITIGLLFSQGVMHGLRRRGKGAKAPPLAF